MGKNLPEESDAAGLLNKKNIGKTIKKQIVYSRAVQSVIWGMPAVNFDSMCLAMIRDAKGSMNQVLYWSDFSDWRNQMLTPDPDVIYVMPFFDTKEAGPMVLEIPKADGGMITGTINDCWQTVIESIGPAGADKGIGERFLILPPGYNGYVPDDYRILPFNYYQGYALLSSVIKSNNPVDRAKAISYAKKIKLYPLAESYNPPSTVFIDASDVLFDATIPYDLGFFESLNRMIQYEPWLSRDKVMIDILRSIGIEKGKTFNPYSNIQETLLSAISETRQWFNEMLETSLQPYSDDKQWASLLKMNTNHTASYKSETGDFYSIDQRGIKYSYSFCAGKIAETAQTHLMALRDRRGEFLDGGKSYCLTIPASISTDQNWSVVIYDNETHSFIRNVSHAGRSSQTRDLKKNADGSIDIYFGPRAKAGHESNWIPTLAEKNFEVCFRCRGAESSNENEFRLPDIEKIV